jgi:hypothetical protein
MCLGGTREYDKSILIACLTTNMEPEIFQMNKSG